MEWELDVVWQDESPRGDAPMSIPEGAPSVSCPTAKFGDHVSRTRSGKALQLAPPPRSCTAPEGFGQGKGVLFTTSAYVIEFCCYNSPPSYTLSNPHAVAGPAGLECKVVSDPVNNIPMPQTKTRNAIETTVKHFKHHAKVEVCGSC